MATAQTAVMVGEHNTKIRTPAEQQKRSPTSRLISQHKHNNTASRRLEAPPADQRLVRRRATLPRAMTSGEDRRHRLPSTMAIVGTVGMEATTTEDTGAIEEADIQAEGTVAIRTEDMAAIRAAGEGEVDGISAGIPPCTI